MRHALFLPLFDELADPRVVARLAAEAEAAGWDGAFVWDHVAYRAPVQAVGDPWVALSAMAVTTERLRLGPMVTPLARRRPVKTARETASLDVLSGGRLVLGVGLGGDRARELSATGEQVDDRVRARMLDEHLEVLAAAWTGEPVRHRGEHYVVDDLRLLPTPVQRPGPPVWVGVRFGNTRPLARAARHDGVFPVDLHGPDQLAELVAGVQARRADPSAPYDVAVEGRPGTDWAAYGAVGATWCLTSFPYDGVTLDAVRGALRDGPG